MKKLMFLLIAVVGFACEGPMGPPGEDGEIIASKAFEIQVDFNEANNYAHLEEYGFNVLASDVTLVYALWGSENGKDIWRLLPQQVFFEEGLLQYNFDFTDVDVNIFMDATFPLSALSSEWTDDQVFRVVVVPADLVGRPNYADYEATMARFNLSDKDFQKRY
ncbi:MAG: hypothetical protein BroJett042_06520 [Bacteroidota bacterium]|mgnify:CR=1 FL=1|nr:MAG: hypothetical protein UZ12_BCD005002438 [Bacteroidetes bacterium OLB12]GIL22139.1 MAG: hypothetical protein BroJett042_06520 [Bacteroidota bacterium]HNU42787.1 hypothetical protein [Cyclobacteriaceae bacterium]